jgi:putative hydrolase of the HAD superfamily
LPKLYQHIFFDLDRTLWHFDENSKKVLLDIFNDFELSKHIEFEDDFIQQYYIFNDLLWERYRENKIEKDELRSERFNLTLKHFKVVNPKLANKIGDYYVEHSPLQTILLPHTIEVLTYLSSKYKLHIITNGFEEIQHIKLRTCKIDHFFNQLTFSEKVGVKKPHPLIFKKAIKNAGATIKNSIMIGDDYYADIYGAQRVKMASIYFNFRQIKHNYPVEKEISCLSELMELL